MGTPLAIYVQKDVDDRDTIVDLIVVRLSLFQAVRCGPTARARRARAQSRGVGGDNASEVCGWPCAPRSFVFARVAETHLTRNAAM